MKRQEKYIPKVKSRILEHISYLNISYYEFYKRTGITKGILTNNLGMSEENIYRYVTCFPEINLEWLLTGKGKMIKCMKKSAKIV